MLGIIQRPFSEMSSLGWGKRFFPPDLEHIFDSFTDLVFFPLQVMIVGPSYFEH